MNVVDRVKAVNPYRFRPVYVERAVQPLARNAS